MIPGEHITDVETRFQQGVNRMFDTPEAEALKPPPHLWPAYLFSSDSRRGFYIPPTGNTGTPVTHARVNHGRWLTACPFCGSHQDGARSDHRFYCAKCHNADADHASIPVVWPADADRIEALLLERPNRENRNWEPYESVDDLVAENARWLS